MRSFNTRLSLLFLALVLVLTAALGVVGLRTAVAVTEETEQRLNRTLASDLAVQFQPYLHDAIDHDAIEEKITYLVGINPRIDLYLLGGDGMIKAGYVHTEADAAPTPAEEESGTPEVPQRPQDVPARPDGASGGTAGRAQAPVATTTLRQSNGPTCV